MYLIFYFTIRKIFHTSLSDIPKNVLLGHENFLSLCWGSQIFLNIEHGADMTESCKILQVVRRIHCCGDKSTAVDDSTTEAAGFGLFPKTLRRNTAESV